MVYLVDINYFAARHLQTQWLPKRHQQIDAITLEELFISFCLFDFKPKSFRSADEHYLAHVKIKQN